MVREKSAGVVKGAARAARPSAVVDTRVIYCGDNLDQLKKLPDGCVGLIYIDPPFNSNRNYEVFWGETKEKRAFEDRHASTQAYIEFRDGLTATSIPERNEPPVPNGANLRRDRRSWP